MFTSVTKQTQRKSFINLIFLSLFLNLFNQIYQGFSYGERSLYMQGMFLIPLLGAGLYALSLFGRAWLSNRASFLLFNSGLAIAISGCLIRGIIEMSGRSTTLDRPYWWLSIAFVILSGLAGHLFSKNKEDSL